MRVRFYVDPGSGQPHIHGHGVNEQEVRDVLARPLEDRPGREGARVALGQSASGRYIRVIYVHDPGQAAVFVVTAYELGLKAKHALRRRWRRKR